MRRHEERDVQGACDDLMILDGWRVIVTDPPHLRGLGVMEPGMCDRLYLRYSEFDRRGWLPATANIVQAKTEVLWIEWKSRTGKTAEHQKKWQGLERSRGALVWCAKRSEPRSDNEFEPTVEGYLAHYRASGLMRKNITL